MAYDRIVRSNNQRREKWKTLMCGRLMSRSSTGDCVIREEEMKRAAILFILVATSLRAADLPKPYVPRPYMIGGVSINGGGYSSISAQAIAGFRVDAPRLIGDVEAGYDTARKVNDGVPGNDTGHILNARARAFYRFPRSGFFVGGGEEWSETVTKMYVKRGVRPAFGGGKDFTSFRLAVLYFGTGSDNVNGTHGVETALTYPSPTKAGHLFFRASLSIYRFHDTVFENGTPEQMRIWEGQKHTTAYMRYGFMYRF
jgi:hypothetical protein